MMAVVPSLMASGTSMNTSFRHVARPVIIYRFVMQDENYTRLCTFYLAAHDVKNVISSVYSKGRFKGAVECGRATNEAPRPQSNLK